MRTTGRIIAASALLGTGLVLASPAAAQDVTSTPCPYPFENCPTPPPGTTPTTPISGGDGGPSTGDAPGEGIGGGGGGGATDGGSTDGGTGGSTTDAGVPVRGASGGAAGLPFTGGEVTLIALAGAAALGGGAVLVAAGRKRAQV